MILRAFGNAKVESKKALKLLQSVYDQFTEGFDTADLRDAQALLRDLRRSPTRGGGRRRVRTDEASRDHWLQ